MTIRKEAFGTFEGREVSSYTIRNANGCLAKLIDFGARLVEMHVPDKTGKTADIVLGFNDLKSYETTDTYFGATCGRYGNRIRDGRFSLGKESFQLTVNEEANHVHGGFRGFDKHVWDAHANETANAITFTLVSPDGDEGYPGGLLLKASYVLADDDRLAITMSGTTDRARSSTWSTIPIGTQQAMPRATSVTSF